MLDPKKIADYEHNYSILTIDALKNYHYTIRSLFEIG